MAPLNLRTKILLSISLIIFVVLGTSTFVHLRDLKKDYLETLTWRSEALAQDIINTITNMQNLGVGNIESMFPALALKCIKLYELNQDKNISHFAVIYASNTIGPHNVKTLWNTPVTSQILLQHLQEPEQITVLDENTYHTLVPVFSDKDRFMGTIDIGTPQHVLDEKVQKLLYQSLVLFVVFLLMALLTVSVLLHVLLTRPVRHLVMLGEQLAVGNLVHIPQASEKGDEVAILTSAFGRISMYLRNLSQVATNISTGDLRDNILPRAKGDVLGIAFQSMTAYLDRLAAVATAIADGELHQDIQTESEHDVLGNAFHAMAVRLRENFAQIQQEMTARRKAQEALLQLNEELEQRVEERTAELAREKYILDTFMETVPDCIYFKDLQGQITSANKAHAECFGFNSLEEQIGKTNFDFLPEELARKTYGQEQTIIQTGEPLFDLELAVPYSDGGLRWSLATKMPLKNEKGEIIGTFGITRDITSLKQTQASLEQAYSKILSLNQQLQEDSMRYYMKALLFGSPSDVSVANITPIVQDTWNASYFCVVLVKLLPTSHRSKSRVSRKKQTKRSQLTREIMLQLVQFYEEFTHDIPLTGMSSQLSDTEAALILNLDKDEQVHEVCSFILSQGEIMLKEYAYTLVLGIGQIVTNSEKLHISYDSARQSLLSRSNTLELQIISPKDANTRKRESLMFSIPREKEQQFVKAVISGQQVKVQGLIKDIAAQGFLEQSSYQKLIAVYNYFLRTASKILAQAPIQDFETNELPFLQNFRAARPETIDELHDRLNEIFQQLLVFYGGGQKQPTNMLVKKLLRYLDRHYHDLNLSLESFAKAFNLNPSYLSRHFKEQTGVNYVEYLALLRLKRAKELLEAHPKQNISEIGIQAGFSGKDTFIRTFKRFEGVTPGIYRKRVVSEG